MGWWDSIGGFVSNIGSSLFGGDSSGGGGSFLGDMFSAENVGKYVIPAAISGYAAYSNAPEKLSFDEQMRRAQAEGQLKNQLALDALKSEIELKKQYGLLGGGGGGNSTGQMIGYYKQRDKYMGTQNAYEKSIAGRQAASNTIIQALNALADNVRLR